MSEESPILLRRGCKKDIKFITNSWLKSFRDGLTSRGIPNDIYYYNHHRIIEKLLSKCLNVVVCNSSNPDQILAYCVAEPTDKAMVFHYVYVKGPFRGLGLAKKLVTQILKAEGDPNVAYSHRTWAVKKMRDAVLDAGKEDVLAGWDYNPYLQWKEVEL